MTSPPGSTPAPPPPRPPPDRRPTPGSCRSAATGPSASSPNAEICRPHRLLRPVDPGALRHREPPLGRARRVRHRHGRGRRPVGLERAGLAGADIDAVLVATVTHPYQTPSAATLLAHRLGATPAAAFDISAACAGFCYGVAPGLGHDPRRLGPARAGRRASRSSRDFTRPRRPRRGVHLRRRRRRGRRRARATPRASGPRCGARTARSGTPSSTSSRWIEYRDSEPRREWPALKMAGPDGLPLGRVADVAGRAEGAGRRRGRGRRPRRVHPAPGQRPDHRRDGQAAGRCPSTSRSRATSPRPATPRPRRSRWRWTGCSPRARRAHGGLALLIGFGAGLAYAAQVVELP